MDARQIRCVTFRSSVVNHPEKKEGDGGAKVDSKGRKIDSLYSVWCSRGGHVRRIRTDENPFFIKENTPVSDESSTASSPGHNIPRAKFVFHLIFLPEECRESRREKKGKDGCFNNNAKLRNTIHFWILITTLDSNVRFPYEKELRRERISSVSFWSSWSEAFSVRQNWIPSFAC